ncbi:MAG TPA: ABC transporter permease [Actinomycetes bacterium]|jgi:ABC-type dipeptide/oligopeptide/nickel transport system permease subunit|nr:ABC transporter permease [Actinomycetes bacterium]
MSSSIDAFAAEPMHDRVDEAAGRRIQGRSPTRLAWERLKRDRLAVVSGVVIVGLFLFAFVGAPILEAVTGHDPTTAYRDTGLTADGLPVGPSSEFWFGTDQLGRDLLVRIAYGARTSLLIGVVVTLFALVIGAVIGMVAGYYRGRTDTVISRMVDVMLGFPFLVTAIALVAVFQPSVWITAVVILLFIWAPVARIVRGQVLSLREREFIEAGHSLGASDSRIMYVDVLPNLVGPVIVYGTLLIPQVIVLESTLSFLGLGVVPPAATLGQMLGDVQNHSLYEAAPWMLYFPMLVLLLTTLAFNLLGDGLRDAFDPGSERTMAK